MALSSPHRRKVARQWSTSVGLIGGLILFFLLAKPIFRDYFVRPNSMMYSFGGDALALYYNTVFHARYGESCQLRSTNYPEGEYIYLTDAQGVISNALRLLRQIGLDVSSYAVGFVNAIPLYLLFAAVAVVYFLLLTLGSLPLTAAVFAPLIVLLSPQIIRMGGHFGLAYPVAIPLAMLWFVRRCRVRKWQKRDVLFFLAALVFTYNNPYVGFNMNALLVGAGVVFLLHHRFRPPYRKAALKAILFGGGALAWVFADFRINDSVNDRVSPQWGFFYYQARFEGFFYPPGSLLHQLLKDIGVHTPTALDFETLLNVGLVPTVALMVGFVVFSLSYRARRFLRAEYSALLWAAVFLALMAANTALVPIPQRWIEESLPGLLMFKAAARLGWPLYFVLSVLGARILDALYRQISPLWAQLFFLLTAAAVWNAEINQYMARRFRDVFHPNIYGPKYEEEIQTVLRQNRIDPADFQAILAMPRYAVWHDKVWPGLPFEAQFWSTRLAAATGLPIINPMLSRAGTQSTLERVQMMGHPLIERSLLSKLPNKKDILLLQGNDEGENLQPGERYLISISERLAETLRYALYRLRLDSLLHSRAITEARRLFAKGYRNPPALHLRFDENPTEVAFYGKGCYQTTPGEEWICTFPPAPFARDTVVVFTAWNYLDHRYWSPGFWIISVRDAAGREIHREKLESRKSNDVQGRYWYRVEHEVYIPRGGSVAIAAHYHQPMRIDEVMIWGKGERPLVDDPQAEGFLIENIWVRKPAQ
ncbi:MAG: hypothetical protein NZM43_09550 [Saprospiraceae bacterium]|nr:hypothetical protein [Saprospiraceae bacterium]MDW8484560.1 hypothetical protein [Saprospiraceae bacterium]